MVKVDLITGFLGSGKTTFIRKYVHYLQSQNEKIGILENDYGAINVDMMLLQDLQKEKVGIEMVAGGCDYDCHKRRFKTKLITMAMLGYTRIIIEPSGIFDMDEFYDTMHEDEISAMLEINNVLAIVNSNQSSISNEADNLFASQIATAGRIVVSFPEDFHPELIDFINSSLKKISCQRTFSLDSNITLKEWDNLTNEDFEVINQSGYVDIGYVKRFSMEENNFDSLFFMNCILNKDELIESISKIWNDTSLGILHRIKGFVQQDNQWIEINSNKETTKIQTISSGQKIIIVIGENLDKEKIETYFPSEYSTYNVQINAQNATKM